MFVRTFIEKIANPPKRSKWKERKVLELQCDFCQKKFLTSKNIKRKMKTELHFCNRECADSSRKNGGALAKRYKQINIRNHGVEHFSQREDVINKRKRTFETKYGVKNPSQLKFVKDKKKKTLLENYGVDNPQKHKEIRSRRKQTCQKKYGYQHATQSPKVKHKTRQTCVEKYGVRNYALSDEFLKTFDAGSNGIYSTKTGYFNVLSQTCFYRSSYELKVLQQLKELEDTIADLQTNYSIPYVFKGKPYRYLVDFFVRLKAGPVFLLETKNRFLLTKHKTQAKIEAAKAHCKENGWQFLLITNDDIQDLNLIRVFHINDD